MHRRGVSERVPGVELLRTYRREWFRSDLVAGVSVAAVALPIGIAYAQLAGFPPVVGIYSCILPPVAYALFGSSRQLVVNPDAAACSIVAETVGPLAAGNSVRYLELSIILTSITGLLCIAGGLSGLGVIANFLSRPILTGYLNGIALTIIVGQLGSHFGFSVVDGGFFRKLLDTISHLNQTHAPTLILGASLLILLLLIKRLLPKTPAPLIPTVHTNELGPLLFGAAGISLVSFCSMMTTARGFAAKNGYRIDVNRDLFALGVCDLTAAFNRGFLTQPLAYVPAAALAAILISSALGLFDLASLRDYYRLSKPEFRQSLVAMIGVMTLGVLQGVLIAVALALFKLLRQASHPRDAILGVVQSDGEAYCATEEEGGRLVPGLIIYRFESSIVFFNADYFSERVRAMISKAPAKPRHFLLDAEAVPFVDVSGVYTLNTLRSELAKQGIVLGIARARGLFLLMLERAGVAEKIGDENLFRTVYAGAKSFQNNGVARARSS